MIAVTSSGCSIDESQNPDESRNVEKEASARVFYDHRYGLTLNVPANAACGISRSYSLGIGIPHISVA
jgi:hypothetical protein